MERDDREWNGSEVAVIGMAGRFPGASTLEKFWENLRDGVESIRFFSDEELLAAGTPPARLSLPALVKAAPVLDDVERFDAALFGIPPHEAQIIDPQQRLFLECAWEALERAGYNGDEREGLVGVYAGLEMNTYLFYNLASQPEVLERAGGLQFEISSDKDYLATRTSYKLDLRGPSLTVQSACSTSLVAIHLASQALLSGECDLALAGGSSVQVPQAAGYISLEGGIKSPDGHCRAFDAAAQGTVFGSGVAVVVLKRLTDALDDGDVIHTVIKGSAINNDGAVKIGYSAPGPEGQYQVIRAAQLAAEVDPATITYVEAHGTGTALGDPIEVSALTRAFRATTERTGFCALGSVKTNVGHLRSAAGVTALIKTTLAMRHRQIPPSLHYTRPNPQIDFAASPFYVNARLADWRPEEGPLRAAVSSFGVGGTNAHVILEEAPPAEPSGPARPWQLLVLSANTATALDTLRGDLAAHFERYPELPLADAAFTLQVGRRTGRHRGFAVARDLAVAAGALAAGRLQTAVQELRRRPVDFLFPGQGSQYPGMGRELYESEPAFRDGVDHCCEALRPLLGLDLRAVLYPAPDGLEEAARRLEQTALAQPALFTVEHSLARLWMGWGVRPRAMLGHSLGEYVAACLAGVFSLEDALALVAERGRLMQSLPAGAMLAVPLPEGEIAPLLGPGLSLAAVNGPARAVVSGPAGEIAALEAELARRGTPGKRLHTSHAFHSGMMDAILAPFTERVRAVRRSAPELPFVSNLTGTWITVEEACDPGYWARHLRGAVRFHDGLRTLTADSDAALLEAGPGQTLSSFARQTLPADRPLARSLPHPQEERTAGEALLTAAGQLWLAGVDLDWKRLHAGERRHRVELPTYPFERQRYWIDRRALPAAGDAAADVRKEISDWFYVPAWVPAGAPDGAADGGLHRWLLLAGEGALAAAMARRLEERGDAVAVVSPGEWDAGLLARLRTAWGEPPDRVVDLRGGAGEPDGGFLSLLALAQELGRQPAGSGVELRVVTSGLQAVGRGEAVTSPGQAVLLGPVRTLPLEHPEIRCAAIDVEPGEDPDLLAELLIAETAAPAADPVVALRGGERWVERFSPVPLGPADERRLPWRERGVYLITGGLGGLGLVLAGELARSVRARLVLTGRGGLPDDPADPRVQGVRRLEALGAEVLVLAADVTDEAAMREVVRRARERFGPIQGAIHAAGVPGGGVIQLKTPEAAERVLAPKVQGTRALAAALADEPLDLLVLCSSTFAVTGGVGQVDYCAANSFLDAFARHRSARGLRTVSIGWGAWQEVGMAAEAAAGTAAKRAAAPPLLASPPLLGRREEGPDGIAWTGEVSPSSHWLLAEHRVAGTPTLPGTTYLELARDAWSRETGGREVEISGVTFVSPLLLPEGSRELRVVLAGGGPSTPFRVESRAAGGPWQEHAHGHLGPLGPLPSRRDIAAIAARCSQSDRTGGWESFTSGSALVFWGARWQSLRRARAGADEALLEIVLPPELAADLDAFGLHPALLDLATAFGGGMMSGGQMLPASYGRVRYAAPLPGSFLAHLHGPRRGEGDETLTLDLTLMTPEGEVLAEIEGFTMRRVARRPEPASAAAPRPAPSGSADWILPEEGVEAFRRVLSRGRFPHIAVSPLDLGRAIATLRRRATERATAAEPAPGSAFPRPSLTNEYVAPVPGLEEALAEVWRGVLGLERVGAQDNFFDLGGDSVIGIQIVARASAQGIQLTPEQLFQHQTIAELARRLSEQGAPPEVPEAAAPEAVPAGGFDPDLSSDDLDKIFSQLE
jgi:phthiocerol/phenolphthiocerol synthesis type-I polyketide synthase E